MTRVCIVGAGAIGGLIGARLAHTGKVQVSALARGETLTALHQHGWRLRTAGGQIAAPATASPSADDLGPQNVVFVTVKAPALSELVPSLAPLLTPNTVIVPAMNGIPWWFCQNLPALNDRPLESVDPGGRRAAVLILFGTDAQHGTDVLLVERAGTLRDHAGQVAFPGGGSESFSFSKARFRRFSFSVDAGTALPAVSCRSGFN